MRMQEKRNFFRLVYTGADAPVLTFGSMKFKVLDISEQGLRFSLGPVKGLKSGDEINGSLTFFDGESFLIRGNILRTTPHGVVLQLITQIPFRKIAAEQRRMISKYKKFG